MDAKALPEGKELLVWGAGEDVIARMTTTTERNGGKWSVLSGKGSGFSPGVGDVTSVSVIDGRRGDEADIAVGRANGRVQLLSMTQEGEFGKEEQRLMPLDEKVFEQSIPGPRRTSPGQVAASWTEWDAKSKLLASCRSSIVNLYHLEDTEKKELAPVVSQNVAAEGDEKHPNLIKGFKFLGQDTVACALGGSPNPLRWGKITPTGLFFYDVPKGRDCIDQLNSELVETLTLEEGTVVVDAIEPVGHPENSNLLLSAWRDGTYRLFDIRTSSRQDAVYRDIFQPQQGSNSLLVYGTNRFVAGTSIGGPLLRIFDFRYPRPYSYTQAMPCASNPPNPHRPRPYGVDHPWAQYCNNTRKTVSCKWHALSSMNDWRPDATIYVNKQGLDGIVSLAKASDLSDRFYCGARGAVIENQLQLTEDVKAADLKPSGPPGWHTSCDRANMSITETGVSLCNSFEYRKSSHNHMPTVFHQRPWGDEKLMMNGHKNSHLNLRKIRKKINRTRRLDYMWATRDEMLEDSESDHSEDEDEDDKAHHSGDEQ